MHVCMCVVYDIDEIEIEKIFKLWDPKLFRATFSWELNSPFLGTKIAK